MTLKRHTTYDSLQPVQKGLAFVVFDRYRMLRYRIGAGIDNCLKQAKRPSMNQTFQRARKSWTRCCICPGPFDMTDHDYARWHFGKMQSISYSRFAPISAVFPLGS